jgi:hypothetical protein
MQSLETPKCTGRKRLLAWEIAKNACAFDPSRSVPSSDKGADGKQETPMIHFEGYQASRNMKKREELMLLVCVRRGGATEVSTL